MTRNDKKAIIRKTQNNIIETYNKIFESDTKSHPIILNGEDSVKATDRSDYIKNPPFGGFFITCSPKENEYNLSYECDRFSRKFSHLSSSP